MSYLTNNVIDERNFLWTCWQLVTCLLDEFNLLLILRERQYKEYENCSIFIVMYDWKE